MNKVGLGNRPINGEKNERKTGQYALERKILRRYVLTEEGKIRKS